MECADRESLESVALPGTGTGVGRVSPDVAAGLMVGVVRGFRPKNLKRVFLVGFEEEMVKAFRKVARLGDLP